MDKGNDPNTYFLFKRHEKCLIHDSYTCGCILEQTKEDLISTIYKFIDYYKFCSTLFVIENGKVKFMNIKTKLKLLDIENGCNNNCNDSNNIYNNNNNENNNSNNNNNSVKC